MSRATSSSTRSGNGPGGAGCGCGTGCASGCGKGRAAPKRAPAVNAVCRPEVLAVKKKTLSNCCAGAAFSSNGNRVPMVLPIPVACLGQEAAARGGRLVHRLRQGPLPLAKIAKRKLQRGQRRIACGPVAGLGLGPGQKQCALRLKMVQQIASVVPFGEHGFLLRADVEIDQGQVDVGPRLLLAQQPPIDARLGPVQVAVQMQAAGPAAP